MKKRILALILAISFIATCFVGCSGNANDDGEQIIVEETTAKPTDDSNFKLSYTQADSLDPFKATSQNNQLLASLVFEPLFNIDDSYEVTNNIASGYSFIDSKTIKVDIKPQLVFSDSTPIGTDDVEFSIKAAMKSEAYGSKLTAFKSVEAFDSSSVYIYLNYEDPYAVNLLTFPICSINDDENGFPIGSGRYKYSTKNGDTVLVQNPQRTDYDPYITTINLVNIAAADSIDNAVNIGNISFAFRDMSYDTSKRFSCATKPINMNNLIYIGVNSYSGITSNPQIRKAISTAVDRSVIAESAYSGYATPAASTFNPNFKSVENVKIFSDTADSTTARQTLLQSGYTDSELSISILVNYNENRRAAANLIKTQLESAGFHVTIDLENYGNYMEKIRYSNFDIYIGEVKIGDDMCLYPFFSSEGGARYGIADERMECDELYSAYLSGEEELGKFILSFNDEMPYIPLVYKKGMICYSKALNGDIQSFDNNLYSNIDSWNFINE